MDEQSRSKQSLNHAEDVMDAAVEDALQTLPMFAPPTMLYQRIMTDITPRPAEGELPVFRIHWMDLALSMFFAGMIGLAMLLSDWLPLEIRMAFAHDMRLFALLRLDWVLWVGLGTSAVTCLAACAIFSVMQMNRANR